MIASFNDGWDAHKEYIAKISKGGGCKMISTEEQQKQDIALKKNLRG